MITVSASWDPLATGGAATTGVVGLPWMLALAYLVVIVGIAVWTRLRRGYALGNPKTWLTEVRTTPQSQGSQMRWVALLLPIYALMLLDAIVLAKWDPLSSAEPFAPGPMVAAVTFDGIWQDDSIEHASSWSWSPGEPCLSECPGPRHIYRLKPGERFWWLQTVRNDGPLPITLVGRLAVPEPPIVGLALLRDPATLSADSSNLRPFEPVTLGAGESVTVAMVDAAADCADPTTSDLSWGRYAIGQPFVYEVLGWRRVGRVFPHFSITEAGCE